MDTFQATGYEAIAKPVFEIDPYKYKSSIRGGVALLYRKSRFRVQEIQVDSPRVVGAEICISDDFTLYCFVVYMPASSRAFEVFSAHVELLETLYSIYSEKGKVLIIGDMNVQIRGPRGNVKENERSTYFLNFLQRCDLLSVNVQMQCTGPCYTFFPETGN